MTISNCPVGHLSTRTFTTLPVLGQCSSMSVSMLKSSFQHPLDDGP
jgi:hypothetical protein